MPFWSQARLGGDESLLTDQETLRGYGAGRYIDNNLFVMNLEMRTRVWDKDVLRHPRHPRAGAVCRSGTRRPRHGL